MAMFLVKRVLSSIVTLFVIITITFFLMHAVPGGPFATNEKLSQGIIKAMEAKYGLDKPLIQQYGIYLKNLVKGDLGMSIASKEGKTVNYIISQKFPVSARLGGLSVLLALILGLLMGCYAALRHEKFVDRLVMFISTLGYCCTGFYYGYAAPAAIWCSLAVAEFHWFEFSPWIIYCPHSRWLSIRPVLLRGSYALHCLMYWGRTIYALPGPKGSRLLQC